MTRTGSPTWGWVTAQSMLVEVTPISIQRRDTNFPQWPAYNFKNPDTQYQSGIDFHLDWGASQFLSKQFFVGLVGYAYQQVTADSGQHPILGPFKSRVLGIGPQAGYIFPIGKMQGYLNLKGYGEFDAANRPSGWNTWLTFAISEAPPESTVTPTRHLVTK